MVFGEVQAIDAGGVGRFGEFQTLVEQRRERARAILDMIEQPDFHIASFYCCPLIAAQAAIQPSGMTYLGPRFRGDERR